MLIVLSALLLAITASAGPVGTGAQFEGNDANLVDEATAGIDWNSFKTLDWQGTAPYREADKTALGWLVKGLEDDQVSGADSGFAGGVKQDDNCAKVISAKAPNKDDLERIYLASKTGTDGHTYLALGWARIGQNSTTASAHVGFEFSKGETPCGGNAGGLLERSEGDLLVVYDFEGGSAAPTLTVREWVLSGTCEISSNNAPCWGPADDLTASGYAEAAVNVGGPVLDELAPGGSEMLGKVEFGEAILDLTAGGVFTAGSCESFGNVYAVSRSSGSSGQAQMKDLVGPGDFLLSNCTVALSTTPSVGAGATVTPGQSVSDVATVTGTNAAGTAPTPSGNVTFSICGPTAADSTDLCTTGGTQVGGAVALAVGNPVVSGQANATSAAVNTAASPLTPGRYCFRADWPGDSNYEGPFTHAGIGNSECFIVAKLPSTTATTSSPTGGNVVPGASASDTATISGSGATPTGTVEFYLCQPAAVTAAGCPSGGDKIGSAVALVNGAATSASTTNTAAIGTYCWRAEYSGDSTYLASSHTNASSECFTTAKQPSQTATTSSPTGTSAVDAGTSASDTATVSGGTGQPVPTGTVEFYLCQPAAVTAAGCPTGSGSQVGSAVTLVAGSATSAATTSTTAVGKYCWRAVYSGDFIYEGSSHTNATTECFLVQDSTSIASAQEWLPNDSATVTAGAGTALSGTLSFTLYETDDCTGTAVPGQSYEFALSGATSLADRTKKTNNTTYFVIDSKVVSWKVVFAPTAGTNVAGSSHCEKTSLTITN